jgi:hypothetical protein
MRVEMEHRGPPPNSIYGAGTRSMSSFHRAAHRSLLRSACEGCSDLTWGLGAPPEPNLQRAELITVTLPSRGASFPPSNLLGPRIVGRAYACPVAEVVRRRVRSISRGPPRQQFASTSGDPYHRLIADGLNPMRGPSHFRAPGGPPDFNLQRLHRTTVTTPSHAVSFASALDLASGSRVWISRLDLASGSRVWISYFTAPWATSGLTYEFSHRAPSSPSLYECTSDLSLRSPTLPVRLGQSDRRPRRTPVDTMLIVVDERIASHVTACAPPRTGVRRPDSRQSPSLRR